MSEKEIRRKPRIVKPKLPRNFSIYEPIFHDPIDKRFLERQPLEGFYANDEDLDFFITDLEKSNDHKN